MGALLGIAEIRFVIATRRTLVRKFRNKGGKEGHRKNVVPTRSGGDFPPAKAT